MTLQPIISIVGVLGCVAGYWAHKYILFNRPKRPVPGTNLINTAIAQVFALGGLTMALGTLVIFELTTSETLPSVRIPIIVSIIMGGVVFLIPYEWIFRNHVRKS